MMNRGIEKGGRELEKTIKLFSKICNVLAPPPKLTIDEWADQKRILSSKTSAEPGRWNTDRVPFQREVMSAGKKMAEYVRPKADAKIKKNVECCGRLRIARA